MVNRVYRMSTVYGSKQAIDAAQSEQKHWLTTVRDKCKDEACLTEAYSSRLDKLVSVKTTISEGEYVTDKAEFSRQEAAFRSSLSEQTSGRLSACPVMVRLIDRTYTTGRDSSYGAFCTLTDDRLVMICDDTMIGKLTFKFSGFAINTDELVDFTQTNCPPGG
jgi:hypothetical protein